MCVLLDCTAVDVVAGQSCCSIVALVVLVMELVTGIQVIRLILSSLHELCQNYGILKGTLVQSLARVKRMHGWPLGLVVLFCCFGLVAWYGMVFQSAMLRAANLQELHIQDICFPVKFQSHELHHIDSTRRAHSNDSISKS